MNDKYERAKQFYRKHHTAIVYSAGVIAGAVGTHQLMSNHSDLFLAVSPENLQKLLDKPGGALKWTAGRTNIFVLNEANPIV